MWFAEWLWEYQRREKDQQKDTSNYGNPHRSPCRFLLNQVCLEFEPINHQFSKALKHASSPINISRMSRIFQVKCAFKCFGPSELASGSFPQPAPPPVLGDPGEFSSKCSGHSAHSMTPGSHITHGGVGEKDKKRISVMCWVPLGGWVRSSDHGWFTSYNARRFLRLSLRRENWSSSRFSIKVFGVRN